MSKISICDCCERQWSVMPFTWRLARRVLGIPFGYYSSFAWKFGYDGDINFYDVCPECASALNNAFADVSAEKREKYREK